jgi:hypothetical protein
VGAETGRHRERGAGRAPALGGVSEYFAALIKARLPAARERLRRLAEEVEEGVGLTREEAERRARLRKLLAAAEATVRRLEEAVGRYGPLSPMPAPRGGSREPAAELAMLFDDIADFAEDSGDPMLQRLVPRLRQLAASFAAL